MFWFRKRPPQPLHHRRWRWSLRSSFGLHAICVGVAIGLILAAVPLPQPPAVKQIVLHAPALAEPPEPPPVELHAFTPHPDNWLAAESVDIQHLEAARADPRWTMLTEPDLENRPAEEQQAASSFLDSQVQRAISAAESQSTEDNLDRLRKLTGQLNDVSTEESVAQVTTQISKLLGVGERATAPAKEPVAGEFDIDTAQLHDVRREMLEDGKFKYTAILIDSAGRTQEAEMPAADGESVYKTFELIKQNPLLERVYRGVVMSLLDKMIKPSP